MSVTTVKTRQVFNFGIRQKLLLVLLLVLLTTLTISGWLTLHNEKLNTLEEINQRGNDISRFVSKSLAYSVVGYDYHTIQLLIDELTSSEDIGYVLVQDRKGKTMGESGTIPNIQSDSLVIFKQTIKLESDRVGELVLGLTTEKTLQRLEDKKYAVLKREAFLILLVALGEFMALSFFIIRPVRNMSRSLGDIVDDKGFISGSIPVKSQDEFGHLAESFNQLSQQLNNANTKLHSKIELADQQLVETNKQLLAQSEQLRKMNENFKKLSITDALTGLCNRRHFEELMDSEIETGRRHKDANSLLILDIDKFKSINDKYGHPGGDAILRDVAEVLKNRMRKTDFVCRIGGEEFAALCKRADKQSAIQLAEDIRKSIEQTTFKFGNEEIKLTISIGIATSDGSDDDYNAEDLYHLADKAVYYSKENGRNRVTHYAEITEDETS